MALVSPFRRSAALAAALGVGTLLTTPREVEAALRNISGDLRVVSIDSVFNGSDISVATSGHYSFTVDTATPDSSPADPEVGIYLDSIISSNVSLGSVMFASDLSNLGKTDVANTELGDFISFHVPTPTLLTGNINGQFINFLQADWLEIGDNPAALNSKFLPDAFHDSCFSQLTTVRQIAFVTPNGSGVTAEVLNFHVTEVPSPGVATLVFVAAGMLAARRKERAPSTATPAAAL